MACADRGQNGSSVGGALFGCKQFDFVSVHVGLNLTPKQRTSASTPQAEASDELKAPSTDAFVAALSTNSLDRIDRIGRVLSHLLEADDVTWQRLADASLRELGLSASWFLRVAPRDLAKFCSELEARDPAPPGWLH